LERDGLDRRYAHLACSLVSFSTSIELGEKPRKTTGAWSRRWFFFAWVSNGDAHGPQLACNSLKHEKSAENNMFRFSVLDLSANCHAFTVHILILTEKSD